VCRALAKRDEIDFSIPDGYYLANSFCRQLHLHGGSMILTCAHLPFVALDDINALSEEMTIEIAAIKLPTINVLL